MLQAAATLAIRIPSQPNVCRSVRERVADFAVAHSVGEEDLENFQTALGEALANAIEHGRSATPIDIEIRIDHERIVATVQDAGIGFSVDATGVTELPGTIAERGRGLPIMRRCSDIFGIRSEPGQGTVVVLGRYLRRAVQGAA